jgi:hypothetical protein
MAWNEATVILLPSEMNARLVDSDGELTTADVPLKLLQVERSDGEAHSLSSAQVIEWLTNNDATIIESTAKSVELVYHDIAIFISIGDNTSVASIECRFRLTKKSHLDIAKWVSYIDQWPRDWQLSVLNISHGSKDTISSLRQAIVASAAWRDFASNFGWPNATTA